MEGAGNATKGITKNHAEMNKMKCITNSNSILCLMRNPLIFAMQGPSIYKSVRSIKQILTLKSCNNCLPNTIPDFGFWGESNHV